jgi:hypothetical protein
VTVIEYVTEEVSRQGHDVFALDGIERVGWMLNAWATALDWVQELSNEMDYVAIRTLGMQVEPHKNSNGFRTCGVRVGSRICPPAAEVKDRLRRLLKFRHDMTTLEFYKEFELIHPFVDGNGRTGKILLNWKNDTLLNPVFPPSDLFGEVIRNP